MGMFDSVYVKCPGCGEQVEFQSKAGGCVLASYNLNDVPLKVLADLDGESEICGKCGRTVTIKVKPVQGVVGVVE